MNNNTEFSWDERLVAQRLNDYFKCPHMSLRDKIFHASLIAQYELEAHNFTNEMERESIAHFITILDRLRKKASSDT